MNYQRNDASSLSFGRRLSKAEAEAAAARQEVEALKKELPAAKQMQQAADVIKAQRTAAKQMIARGDSTVEQLQGIDASVLTPAIREQLRHSITDAAYRQMDFQSQPFRFSTPDAELRFRNWQTSYANQAELFEAHNAQPQQEPQRPFDLWVARQDSAQGRYERRRAEQQRLQRDVMLKRAEAARDKKPDRSNGITLGNIRPLDS